MRGALVRRALPWLLWLPLSWACQAGDGVVILQYHHVSSQAPASTSVTPQRFRAHLQLLEAEGYQVVSLKDALRRLADQQPLPARAVAITFDDGYRSVLTEAHPELLRRGWPYTLFVSPAVVDGGGRDYLDWPALRRLQAEGATIASHGLRHEHLVRRRPGEGEALWRSRIRADLQAAQARLEEQLGSAPRWLAYPYGEYSAALLEVVGELGLVGVGQHSGPASRYSDPRALPRFPASGVYSDPQTLRTKLASLPFPITAALDADPLWHPGQQVRIRLAQPGFAGRVRCFAPGRAGFEPTWLDARTFVLEPTGLPPGRSRTNCTATGDQAGRFYWYSQPWITRLATGGWVPER